MKIRKVKRSVSIVIAIGICGLSLGVIAADGPYDDAIKVRQAMFQMYGFNAGLLGAMAKEKIPYDADVASEAAANLDAAANLGQSQFWPQGSDNETDGNARTRALPVIWSDFASVSEKADALKMATAAMASAAGDGLDALQGAMGDVGAACKACHDEIRAEE